MINTTTTPRRDSGQAAVESAIALPLTVFLILGTLQLFLMLQARIMAQYAVARAGRAGSLNYGGCDAMTQAAIAALLPVIQPFLTPGGGAAGKYAAALGPRLGNKFDPVKDAPHDETILWITREGTGFTPVVTGTVSPIGNQDSEDAFDLPWDPGAPGSARPLTLELQMTFWYPLRIPFANWVISAMVRASYGVTAYGATNPLMPLEQAQWQTGPALLAQDVSTRLEALAQQGKYTVPIRTTFATRMMTPPRKDAYPQNDCRPQPNG